MTNLRETAHPEGVILWVRGSAWRKRIVRQRRDQTEQQHSIVSASWWLKFEQWASQSCCYSRELGPCFAFPTMVGSAKCLHWYSFKRDDFVDYTVEVSRKPPPPVACPTLPSLRLEIRSSWLCLYHLLLSFSHSNDQVEEAFPGDVLLSLQTCMS